MKDSLVAYNFRHFSKKIRAKIVKYGYIRGYPKQSAIQIWSPKILGINHLSNKWRANYIAMILLCILECMMQIILLIGLYSDEMVCYTTYILSLDDYQLIFILYLN